MNIALFKSAFRKFIIKIVSQTFMHISIVIIYIIALENNNIFNTS